MARSNSSFKVGDPRFALMQGNNHSRYKHGMASSRIYTIWTRMKSRCLNSKDGSYDRYGGRGIKLCEEWHTFEGFYADMGASYVEGLSIERRDNNKGYEKSNCEWIPVAQQGRNKRSVGLHLYKGQSYTTGELARMTGFKRHTIYARMKHYKWSVTKTVETPIL